MKGRNPQQLLRLSMFDFPLILQVRLSAVDRIQPQRNIFVTGVENEATGDSELNGSPDLYVKPLIITTVIEGRITLRTDLLVTVFNIVTNNKKSSIIKSIFWLTELS